MEREGRIRRTNELVRKIKNKDKQSLVEDFRLLRTKLDPMLETTDMLQVIIFIRQLQDFILEEAD